MDVGLCRGLYARALGVSLARIRVPSASEWARIVTDLRDFWKDLPCCPYAG